MHHGNLIYYPLNPNEESGNKDKSLITKHEFVPYMPPVRHINVNHIHQATKRPEQQKSKSFQLSNHSSHSSKHNAEWSGSRTSSPAHHHSQQRLKQTIQIPVQLEQTLDNIANLQTY
jgi:hypothetical protein